MTVRTDIQALRGLAVLLVVLYHAKIAGFRAGYLGVDVFFVISGFLITSLIQKRLETGTFSFSEFYLRRAKRLLPAAYVTFGFTALCSFWLLSQAQLKEFCRQLLGAITFSGNFVLWRQTNYFDAASELKPLLHVWSLAVEEQYYLFLPAALFLTPRRYWKAAAVALFFASLAACLVAAPFNPSAVFYLLPTRVWELTIGSIGALAFAKCRSPGKALSTLFWMAIISLCVVPVAPLGTAHPGFDAIIVCTATLVVILRQHGGLDGSLFVRGLAVIGDFSYSLYLVHWPVIAFLYTCWMGEVPVRARLVAVALSLGLSYLLYRFVEQPVRTSRLDPKRTIQMASAGSLALLLVALALPHVRPKGIDYVQLRRFNYGFSPQCQFANTFTPVAACRNSEQPKTLVWGDSYAMQLVPGIAETSHSGVIQATRTVCGPFLDIAPIYRDPASEFNRSWAESCLDFNHSVFEYLARTTSIEIVVMSSPFERYILSDRFRQLSRRGPGFVEHNASVSGAVDAMKETIQALRRIDKRVVIIAPPPSSDFDIGACSERRASGKLLLGPRATCEMPVTAYKRSSAEVFEFLDRVQHDADVSVISFDAILCGATTCISSLDGESLYRDAGHLSYAGSRVLARHMNLGSVLEAVAR